MSQLFLLLLGEVQCIETMLTLHEIVVDALFTQLTYAQLVIDGCDGTDFLFTVEGGSGEPPVEFFTLLSVGSLLRIDEHVCLLVAYDISSYRLSKHRRVAIDIE